MGRLTKFLQLSRAERRLLIHAAVLLAAVRVALWTVPFQTVCAALARVGARRTPDPWRISPRRLARIVSVASEYVPGATCLTQALVAKALLQRHGHPALLRLGVARGDQGDFRAHAWVECEGEVSIGRIETFEQYSPLPLPGGGGDQGLTGVPRCSRRPHPSRFTSAGDCYEQAQ